MVGVFMRSLSFPDKIRHRSSSNSNTKPPNISYHNRSISLPCNRSHPLISQLKIEINSLKINNNNLTSSASLCDSLARLKDIHDSLIDILHLPQTQESLRRHPKWAEHLLEDFLRFVDVYGIFQQLILQLRELQLAALVAVRKKDESKIFLYLKSRKKLAKEMSKLVSTVKSIGQKCSIPLRMITTVDDAEIVCAVGEVVEATVAVSVAVFDGISVSFGSRKGHSWLGLRLPTKNSKRVKVEKKEGIQEFQEVGEERLWGLGKKGVEEVKMVLNKMQDLETCICGIEGGGERVFRCLINTRVLLLNSTLTQ